MSKFHELFTGDYEQIEVLLIGTGATGSRMAVALMELNEVLLRLGRKGIKLHLIDDDLVENHNCGKQKFLTEDIGRPKALVLAERLSYTFNASVEAHVMRFNESNYVKHISNHANRHNTLATVYISTVDNLNSRKDIESFLEDRVLHDDLYWMDLGNSDYNGQMLFRSFSKKNMIKELSERINWSKFNDAPDEVSCSMAESLNKQSFMINQFLVDASMVMLSELFIKGMFTVSELYVNLRKFQITSKSIK